MSVAKLLLIRRDDNLWAVERAAVRAVRRDAMGVAVLLDGGELRGDEVTTPGEELPTHRAGGVSRVHFDEPVAGFTIFNDQPVLILDPSRPPRALLSAPEEGVQDDEA